MQSRSFCSSTELRVFLEDVVPAGLRGVLEPEDGLGVEEVILAVAAPLVLAAPSSSQPGRLRGSAKARWWW